MRVYYDQDCKFNQLKDKKIAIVGYGSQGHAHAANLRDSGCTQVRVALRPESSSNKAAQTAGFETSSVEQAAQWADIVMMATPDELHKDIYEQSIRGNMKAGAAIAFAHGFSVHFHLVEPPEDVDVFMVAPKGPGHTVRSEYQRGAGVPCLAAAEQDHTGNAFALALAYASGLGGGRSGIIETSFREECETDLFGEQVVLCGGLTRLIRNAYETLVEAGYTPEMAYFECLHEVKLIVDLMYEGGMANMRYSISNTAEYGDYTRGDRIIGPEVKAEMKCVLEDIQSGQFTREWMLDNQVGQTSFKTMRRRHAEHEIEEVGKRLRGMMPWIAGNKIVDEAAE